MFVDEARQMRWAAVGRVERPMESGKALQVWAIAPFMQADATRGVWAARAVLVAAGVLALSAAYLLGSTLGTTLTGFIAGSLYLLCPFALFYDRMALGDAFLSGFAALSAVASIQLTRGHGRGVWLGCFMAAAIVAKATGMVVLATPVLAAVLLGRLKPEFCSSHGRRIWGVHRARRLSYVELSSRWWRGRTKGDAGRCRCLSR